MFRVALALVVLFFLPTSPAWAWGRGHKLIRAWAVARLPAEQKKWLGDSHLQRLCTAYSSIQDEFAGGGKPEYAPYCTIPGVRVSLHDVNPAAASVEAMQWFLFRIAQELRAGRPDEAMKFLGVLCHWNEDPGSLSAHSSPVSEAVLRQLLPPPADKENLNYLFGYGGIADKGVYTIPEEEYRPRLLGASIPEAAMRIYQHQRLLQQQAAAQIVPLVQAVLQGDLKKADRERAHAALRNARHTADLIYTALCLATDKVDAKEAGASQRLTDWRPEIQPKMIPRPYYVVPFLVNQALDAERRLHALALPGNKVAFGFGTGAPFDLPYVLGPGGVYDVFTCRVGLHPVAGPQGKVVFDVLVNGAKVFSSGALAAGQQGAEVRVALPATPVVNLTLRTLAAEGSSSTHNLAVWAEPTLHRNQQVPAYRPPVKPGQ